MEATRNPMQEPCLWVRPAWWALPSPACLFMWPSCLAFLGNHRRLALRTQGLSLGPGLGTPSGTLWCGCQLCHCLGTPSTGTEQLLLTMAPVTDCPAFWNFHHRYQVLSCGRFHLTFSKIEKKPLSLSLALRGVLQLQFTPPVPKG